MRLRRHIEFFNVLVYSAIFANIFLFFNGTNRCRTYRFCGLAKLELRPEPTTSLQLSIISISFSFFFFCSLVYLFRWDSQFIFSAVGNNAEIFWEDDVSPWKSNVKLIFVRQGASLKLENSADLIPSPTESKRHLFYLRPVHTSCQLSLLHRRIILRLLFSLIRSHNHPILMWVCSKHARLGIARTNCYLAFSFWFLFSSAFFVLLHQVKQSFE